MDIVHKLISKEAGGSSSQDYERLSMDAGAGAPGEEMAKGGAVEMTVPASLDAGMDTDIESQGLKARRNGNGAAERRQGGAGAPNSVNYEKVQTLCLITISGVLTVAAMQHLRAVMVPLVLAFLVSYPLTAVVDFIYVRGGCPKVRSAAAAARTPRRARPPCGAAPRECECGARADALPRPSRKSPSPSR